jgi:biotin carboxylase
MARGNGLRHRLLVLGGGVYQVPLIRRARELDLETIVVTPAGPYPGIRLGDHHWDLDTTDEEAVLQAARSYGIDAVVTTGTDVCLPVLGRIVDELRLHGPSESSARMSADKTLMKRAFKERGVPTADFEIVGSLAGVRHASRRLGFPLIVKASDSSGSRGVTRVDSSAGLELAWGRAWAISRNKRIVVERCLKGVEFGAQAFVTGDEVVAVFAHNDVVTPPPFQTPIGHSLPASITSAQFVNLREVVCRAVRAVGIRDAVCNVDLMFADGQVQVLEIGARMGATCLPENVAIFAGLDVYGHLIRLALGKVDAVRATCEQPNASLLLRSNTAGIVQEVFVPSALARHPAVVELQIDVKPGDRVSAFQVGPDRIGHLIVTADTAARAAALAQELADSVRVEITQQH